jgi:hypothetical protein
MLRWALIFAALAPIFYFASYWATIRSDAFAEARRFLKTSAEISEAVGDVEKISLDPFGYRIRGEAGGGGSAQFVVSVRGSKGSCGARMILERQLEVWRVAEFYVERKS